MTAIFGANSKLAFVGGGNMAEALLRGIIRSELFPASCISVGDTDQQRRAHIRATFGVETFADNADAVCGAAIVVLAVKPQVMGEVLAALRSHLAGEPLIVSIAAGIKTRWIEERLGGVLRVIRVMPNMPALAGVAASVYCCGRSAKQTDARLVEALLKSVGVAVCLDESHMDAVTALSGSGPAYVLYLIESMVEAALSMGLDGKTALTLTAATVEGAARLLKESGLDAIELRRRVTSPGGTTAAAVAVLDEGHVRETIVNAIRAAQRRAGELSA